MNILIAGCGKTGGKLAMTFHNDGHDVCIISQNQSDVEKNLDTQFNGSIVYGIAIDQDTLKKSGIDTCDVFIALTEDDNTNIMAAELAREIFKVPRILARVIDHEKANIFEDMNIETICPTELVIDAISSSIKEDHSEKHLTFGSRTVSFTTMDIPKEFIGVSPHEITYENDETLFGIISPDGTLTLVGDYDGVLLYKGQKLIFSKII